MNITKGTHMGAHKEFTRMYAVRERRELTGNAHGTRKEMHGELILETSDIPGTNG